MQSPLKQRPPRKFFCDFQGCGKSFTRAEHLQRHELNHRDSPNTCTRCFAHFARPDLLERHMERHAQKDKEAGGDGLGVLVTRKRCWRDENGNITTKRPASSVAAIGKALEAQQQRRGYSSDEGGPESGEGTGGPMSPPYCSGYSNRYRKDINVHDEQAMGDVDFRYSQNEQQLSLQDQHMPSNGFLGVPAAPQQPRYQLGPSMPDITALALDEMLASCQADFNDLFSTDTAQSFNMPFTALNNYNWLFEELRVSSGQESICIPFDQSIGVDTDHVNTAIPVEPIYGSENQLLPTPTNEHEFLSFEVQSQQQQQQFIRQSLEHLEHRPVEASLGPHVHFPDGPASTISQISGGSHSNPANSASIRQQSSLAPENSHHQQHTHATALPTQHLHNSPYSSGPHSQTASIPEISASSQHPLPEIDEVARQQALELIVQVTRSSVTGEPQFGWDDPLLSLSALQNYSDLFFSRFNPSYHIIHRQSFDPSSVNTLLLVSVLMMGATYGEKDAHQMAVRVHDVLREVFVSPDYFHATPELWMLQTALLIEVFERSRAGMKQHDMAHLFHGLFINT